MIVIITKWFFCRYPDIESVRQEVCLKLLHRKSPWKQQWNEDQEDSEASSERKRKPKFTAEETASLLQQAGKNLTLISLFSGKTQSCSYRGKNRPYTYTWTVQQNKSSWQCLWRQTDSDIVNIKSSHSHQQRKLSLRISRWPRRVPWNFWKKGQHWAINTALQSSLRKILWYLAIGMSGQSTVEFIWRVPFRYSESVFHRCSNLNRIMLLHKHSGYLFD